MYLSAVSHVLQSRLAVSCVMSLEGENRSCLSGKPNVQLAALLAISSPAWPEWGGLAVPGSVSPLSSVLSPELTLPP